MKNMAAHKLLFYLLKLEIFLLNFTNALCTVINFKEHKCQDLNNGWKSIKDSNSLLEDLIKLQAVCYKSFENMAHRFHLQVFFSCSVNFFLVSNSLQHLNWLCPYMVFIPFLKFLLCNSVLAMVFFHVWLSFLFGIHRLHYMFN